MYVRQINYKIGPGKREFADKLGEQFEPLIRSQKGFINFQKIADDVNGEYGCYIYFETAEDAENLKQAARASVEKILSGVALEPPTFKLFKVED